MSLNADETAYFMERVPVMRDLGLHESVLPKLRAYLELLWSSNKELNLISRKMSFEELIDNHVIDCLLPLNFFPNDISIAADFGAGGGLPGVIYALQFPELRYQLFEKSPLKQAFLGKCAKLAPNLEVHAEIPLDLKAVQWVTARAFKPLDVMLDMSRSFYARGGSYFLLKGRREKIDEELELAQKKFKDLSCTITPLKSPILEVERHLVIISGPGA